MRSPKKRTALLALATILVALIIAAFIFKSPPEPSYKGEPITAWLDGLTMHYGITGSSASLPTKTNAVESMRALRATGTKAIPFIIIKLNQNDSPWRNRYRESWPNLPPFIKLLLPVPNDISFGVEYASEAFDFIGTNAIPCLLPKMHDSNPAVREAVLDFLGWQYLKNRSTNDAIALFTSALYDPDAWVRSKAIMGLEEVGSAASNAVPALIKNLESSEIGRHKKIERVHIHASSTRALGNMGPVAAAAVPALTNLMATGDSYARVCAANAIWRITSNENLSLPVLIAELPGFHPYSIGLPTGALIEMGPRAKAAFPMLSNALNRYREQETIDAISNALVAIDPEAAAKLFAEKSTNHPSH